MEKQHAHKEQLSKMQKLYLEYKAAVDSGVCVVSDVDGCVESVTADEITIQYGGSMKDGNAAELLAKANVDGGLIGGASLKTDKFTAIVDAANA